MGRHMPACSIGVYCGLWRWQYRDGSLGPALPYGVTQFTVGPCLCQYTDFLFSILAPVRCTGSTVELVEACRRHRQSGALVPGGTHHQGRPSLTVSLGTACLSTPPSPATHPAEATGLRWLAGPSTMALSSAITLGPEA